MKKIFIALSMMVIPLTAYAQSGGEQALQAAADNLKPAFCSNDLEKAIQIVESCYAKVDEDSEHAGINQCVIEDIFVLAAVKAKQKQYLDNFQTDPYANLDYVKNTNVAIRWSKHPNFLSNHIANVQDMTQIGNKVGKNMVEILDKEGCLNMDKLK